MAKIQSQLQERLEANLAGKLQQYFDKQKKITKKESGMVLETANEGFNFLQQRVRNLELFQGKIERDLIPDHKALFSTHEKFCLEHSVLTNSLKDETTCL